MATKSSSDEETASIPRKSQIDISYNNLRHRKDDITTTNNNGCRKALVQNTQKYDGENTEEDLAKEMNSGKSRRDNDAIIISRDEDRGRGGTSGQDEDSPTPCHSVPKWILASDMIPTDHQGWLVDQLRGRKVWCAVSDMLFCVFDEENSHVSKEVIFLPVCTIRHMEFKSANQEGKILNGVARHFVAKTVSGIDKFQFLLENTTSKNKYMFGVSCRQQFNQWLYILEKACTLDVHCETSEKLGIKNVGNDHVTMSGKIGHLYSSSLKTRPSGTLVPISSTSYSPSQTPSPRMSLGQTHDVSKDTVDDIRKKIKKDQHDAETKPSPLKARHEEVEPLQPQPPAAKNEHSRKSRPFFRIKSSLDLLLRRKKRSASADDVASRRKLSPAMPSSSTSPGLSAGQSSMGTNSDVNRQSSMGANTDFNRQSSMGANTDVNCQSSMGTSTDVNCQSSMGANTDVNHQSSLGTNSDINRQSSMGANSDVNRQSSMGTNSDINRQDSMRTNTDVHKSLKILHLGGIQKLDKVPETKRQNIISQPIYSQKNSINLKPNLRRTATDLKDRIFNFNSSTKDFGSKPADTKLKDLEDIRVSGCLQYRMLHTFIKAHCAVCRGCFYVFKRDRPQESAVLMVVLNQCSVMYIAEPEERQRSLFVFKICQPRGKSVYLCADDQLTFMKWMMALQTEASKMQVDENLTTEVRENRSSQKKRQTRELKIQEEILQQETQRRDLPAKLNSWPYVEMKTNSAIFLGNEESGGSKQVNVSLENWISAPECSVFTVVHNEKQAGMPTDGLNLQQQRDDNNKEDDAPEPIDVSKILSTETRNKDLEFTEVLPKNTPFKPCHRRAQTDYNLDVSQLKKEFVFSNIIPTFRRTASLKKDHFQHDVQTPKGLPTVLSSDIEKKHETIPFPSPLFSVHSKMPQTSEEESLYACEMRDDFSDLDSNYLKPANCETNGDSFPYDLNQSTVANSELAYHMTSSVHDDAVKGAWSADEDFLLEVVREKLRRRSQREADGRDRRVTYDDVCVVNDKWNVMDSVQACPPINVEKESMELDSASQEAHDVVNKVSHMAGPEEEGITSPPGQEVPTTCMAGSMEKKGFNDKWQSYWCVLRDGCLYSYLKASDEVPADVTELRGYQILQLVDKFQGKRFVLSLKHANYISLLLSVDSREKLRNWYQALRSQTDTLTQPEKSPSEPITLLAQAESKSEQPQASTTQSIKQKLLAEMLRQKLELEKIQAARNGLKFDLQHNGKHQSTSSTNGASLTTDDDRICALTRLKQRRMSTQIKLDVIQKQMEASNSSLKEKKTVFQLGKKKPDLVQGHTENQGHRPDLEEQVKLLSSQLQELDTCITSHGALTPWEQSPSGVPPKNKNPRHSCDPMLLREFSLTEAGKDCYEDSDGDSTTKVKEKDKDVGRSTSLKYSVQKLAHKTLAKANWHWHKKDTPAKSTSVFYCQSLSDVTPDVIDMTNINNNNSQSNSKLYTVDTNDIPAPPDNFQTDYTFLTGTLPGRRKTPKERILSKLSSSSLTNLDKVNSRLKPSKSSPSLAKPAIKQASNFSNVQSSPIDNESVSRLSADIVEGTTASTLSDPNIARSQGNTLVSPRREVNPSALAEIEAFEELSLKFLTSAMK